MASFKVCLWIESIVLLLFHRMGAKPMVVEVKCTWLRKPNSIFHTLSEEDDDDVGKRYLQFEVIYEVIFKHLSFPRSNTASLCFSADILSLVRILAAHRNIPSFISPLTTKARFSVDMGFCKAPKPGMLGKMVWNVQAGSFTAFKSSKYSTTLTFPGGHSERTPYLMSSPGLNCSFLWYVISSLLFLIPLSISVCSLVSRGNPEYLSACLNECCSAVLWGEHGYHPTLCCQ